MSFDLYRDRVAPPEPGSLTLGVDATVRRLVAIGDLLTVALVVLYLLGAGSALIKAVAVVDVLFIAIRAAMLFVSSGRPPLSIGLESRKETP